ncbi:MAG TPA: hypothetical protein PLP64_07630 [Pseudothermotoga sp.]|nr:hypothetical protein [Pseudothermotoga sp.]HPP70548.1 hypothetical protein [Pseudothermotoga sp.]
MIDKIVPACSQTIKEYLKKPRLEDMKIILTNKKTTIAPFVTDKQVEVISPINEIDGVKKHFKGIHRGLRRCTLSSDGTVTNSTQ